MRKLSSSSEPKPSLYQEITERIITELEQGHVPWVQPWEGARCALGLPRNGLTERAYSGINILILWDAVIQRGFSSQRWLTFRQALSAGGSVRKGEKGITICYADRFVPREEKARAAETGEEAATVPFLKRYTVFNVEQCENFPNRAGEPARLVHDADIVPAAEALMVATGADIRIGGDKAFYHYREDYIRLPPQASFFAPINYYRTAFHELGHWTGHASRLGRNLTNRYGSEGYAREELVAELASAFLCASHAIEPTVRHADYIGAWLSVLRDDARAIFQAASMASKAAVFIFGSPELQSDTKDGVCQQIPVQESRVASERWANNLP